MIWLLICLVKKINPIVTELYIREKNLNISLVFITQSYFAVPKNISLNSTHYFVMKIPNKREIQTNCIEYLKYNFKTFWIFIKKVYWETMFLFGYWY